MKEIKKPIILVSSSVYGYEDLLDMIYGFLVRSGYEVWMSHKGTMPVNPNKSAFENCIEATEKCDLFLGIITPFYGSGKNNDGGLSITHQEVLKAIELNKPRWFLVHDYVVFTKLFLKYLHYNGENLDRNKISLEKNRVFDDLRVLDMHKVAARLDDDDKPIEGRAGNWVQKFHKPDDALLFAVSQFSRFQDIEQFLKENLENRKHVINVIKEKEARK